MSKRDVSNNTGDERTETNPSVEFLENDGLNMGKEVKIGLGVILVLLVVFGAVLYYRLSGPPAEAATTDAENQPAPAESVAAANDPLDTTASATVVATTAGLATEQPRSSVTDMAQWNVVSDGDSSGASGAESSIPDAPTYAPRSVVAQSPSRSDPFRQAPTEGDAGASGEATAEASETEPSATGMAYADSFVPAGPTEQEQASRVEVYSPPSNPLRHPPADAAAEGSVAQGDPLESGPAAASSSMQTAAGPSTAQDTRAPQATGTFGATASPSLRVAQAPAAASPYGSPYGASSADARASDPGSGSPWASRPSYGANPSYSSSPSYPPYGSNASRGFGSSSGMEPSGDVGISQSAPQATAAQGKYAIQPNESYWVISKKLYGTGAYFQALAEHNRDKFPDPDRLQAGEEISTPTVAELERKYPSLCPKPEHREATKRHLSMASTPARLGGGRVYVVQEGDTLFDIARFELGKAARWAEIYRLNRDAIGSDFDHLTPGMQLVLPEDQPSGTVTQRADDVYQR